LLLLVDRPLLAWWIVLPADVLCALVLLPQADGDVNVWPWPAPVLIGYLFVVLAVALREKRPTLVGVWLVTG
ncbi:sensor histidine kinase, partial [Streptomyces beijiangensis]|nr:sensor histidine kinase [Streptomyces beijiangensis]